MVTGIINDTRLDMFYADLSRRREVVAASVPITPRNHEGTIKPS